MATFGLSYTLANSTGHTASKWFWRPAGTSLWTSIITSGMSYSVSEELDNTVYDFQIQNINNDDNPTCATFQAIGFTDPDPVFSVSNNSISFEFDKPTEYITGYRATIALYSTPETVLQTIEIPSPGDTVTGTFSGLQVATNYAIALLVAANEFDYTFNYNKITTNLSSCYPPIGASAILTSGTNLTIMWTSPISLPVGGFMGSYRRKGVTIPYQTFITSGTTSGNTYSIDLAAPASYDGFIQSICNDEILSQRSPFGVNAYWPLGATAEIYEPTTQLFITLYIMGENIDFTSIYDTATVITFDVDSISKSVQFTLPAEVASIATLFTISGLTSGSVITNLRIPTILSEFNNGGQIQQLDTVLTPDYFKFYDGLSSGATWNGNPATLPSFTLDNFIPTEQDTEGNIIMGLLNFSWIYDSVYLNGVSPYTFTTLQVIDPGDNSIMGSVILSVNPIGARSGSITITKQMSSILSSTQFIIKQLWSNGVSNGTLQFYLPEF